MQPFNASKCKSSLRFQFEFHGADLCFKISLFGHVDKPTHITGLDS